MERRREHLSSITAKPFIPWVGGKEKLQNMIRPVFPRGVSRYVEHFGGSGAILLGMPKSPRRLDVYNDFDTDLANLFLCVRDRPLALLRELSFLPLNSEAEFEVIKCILSHQMPPVDFTEDELAVAAECFSEEEYEVIKKILLGRATLWDVRRAAAFFKYTRCSFSGTLNSFGIRKTHLSGFSKLIQTASDRLEGVPVTNRDFCDSIKVNNKPDTLHYCDPPYYRAEDKYRILFKEGDHIRLHDALRECVGHVVVSYNFCPFICELYEDFFIMRFERQNPLAQTEGAVYEEVVITNYDPIPVIESNTEQISMFTAQSPAQEQGKLVLIHTPKH